ncbi:hypothetical protein [uncultured Shewanella sp.]|uniref:hypothetical protein n=1 Tax=uncultured Shewanella sp. TaxID=173975 RepID=UPI00344CEE15
MSEPALFKLAREIGQPMTSFVIESDGAFSFVGWPWQATLISVVMVLGAGAAILADYLLNELKFKS